MPVTRTTTAGHLRAPARLLAWGLALGLGWGVACAQRVGEVVHSTGVVTAQKPGESARIVAQGDTVEEGDVLSTGRRAFTIVRFGDGAQMTLRPDTALAVDRYAHDGTTQTALMRLVRGGLRAVTGLVARNDPNAYRLQAGTSTIGIRGTDFDARLCESQACHEEEQRLKRTAAVPAAEVVARVVLVTGSLAATDHGGARRVLVVGAPIYEGDLLESGEGGFAVIAFRDESRVTLQARTSFRIERYRYSAGVPAEGSALLRLVRGGLRAVTGQLARARPRSFQLAASTATIGIRGTGVDAVCRGVCSPDPGEPGEGLYVHVWEGAVDVDAPDGALAVGTGATAFLRNGERGAVLLAQAPQFLLQDPAPRPDRVPVDFRHLFGVVHKAPLEAGLYVLVRDGHVTLELGGRSLDLGRGESGRVDFEARALERFATAPLFLELDPVPRPDRFDPALAPRIDLGPGAPRGGRQECEVR